MTDPVSAMAIIGMGASAGGGILSAVGNMQKGQAESSMYQYQAGVAQLNAQIAKKNADYALATGETQAGIKGMEWRSKIGDTTAKMGASGVAVGSGSSKDVLNSEHLLANIDQGTIRNNAARQAYGYNIEAEKQTSQIDMYNKAASNASSAGSLAAMGSILGGVSSVASKWSSGSSSGVWGGTGGTSSSGSDSGPWKGLSSLY